MPFFEKIFGRKTETAAEKENRPALGKYVGELPREEQERIIKEIKEHPEKFPAAEYGGVQLARANEERIADGSKEYYFIEAGEAGHEGNNTKRDIAGYETLQIFPKEKTIYFEAIEIFDGSQPEAVSRGNFRGRKIGERSILALVRRLNDAGFAGWKIKTTAINRKFIEKAFKPVFSAKEDPGGWDEFTGTIPSFEQALAIIEARDKTNRD